MGLFDDVLSEMPKKNGLFDDVLAPPERSLGDTAGGLTLDLLSGAMRAAKSVPDLALMGRAAARNIPLVGDIVGSRAGDAPLQVVSNFFGRGITAADELEPESYGERRSAPIIRRDEAGGFAGLNVPTPEAIAGTVTESLPQIPQLLAGGGLGSAALRGLGASPRIAQALGLGASNAALVSPQQYADTLEEAGIAEAVTEAERQAAERKALTAAGLTGVLSTGTGAAGAALAAPLGVASRSLPAALAKGFAADAPFEGIEEGGQSLIGDYALGRELDFLGAADAGLLGALAGGVPGSAIAGTQYVGDRGTKPSGLFDDVLMPSEDHMAETLGGRIVPQPLGEAVSQDIPAEDTADLDRLLNAISPEVLERALGELVQDADAPFRRPEPVQPVAAKAVGAARAEPAGQPNIPVTPLVEESTQPAVSSQEIPDVQEQPQERSGETLRPPQPRRSGEPAALPGGDSGVRAAAEAIAGSPATERAGEPGGTREPARDAGEAAGGNRLPATEPEVRADQPRPADAGTEGGGRVEAGQEVRTEVSEGQEVRQEVDDRPGPPTLVQYGKRRQASATSTPEQRARAEARVNRLFRDELDPTNPDIEVRMENGRTFPESTYTRKLIADSMTSERPAETLLKGISEQPGVSEDQRWLANRLAPIMTSLGVKLVEPAKDLPYAGAYNNTNNTMWIRQAAPSTVIHEALHGATSALLTSKVARDTNPTVRKAYNEFNDLLGTLQSHLAGIDVATLSEPVQELVANKQGPLSNIKELLTYGMTDKDFQDFLRTVPAPEGRGQARNLWQSFKDAIISLFGKLTNSQRSYLDALIESTADLVEFADANPKATRMIQKSEAARLGAPMDAAAIKTPQTQTASFKKWFGDSKVVDVDGQPLVVYHGTTSPQGFDRFGYDEAAKLSRDLGLKQDGTFYFAANPEIASTYADEEGGSVMPVYLRMTNPLIVDARGSSYNEPSGKIDPLSGKDVGIGLTAMYDATTGGHDGAIIRNVRDDVSGQGEPTDVYIAFERTQIKSATGNVGTFDPSDPSIDAAGIRRSRQDAEKDAEVRRQEAAGTLPVPRGTPGWNYDDSVWEGPKGSAKRARMRLQDKMTGWADVQNQIAEQVGQAIPDAQNVYQAENLMHGRVSEAIDRLERNHIKPLVEAMRKADVLVPQLEEYLYARHVKERNEQIAKINPKMPDGGSGVTTAEADSILKTADRAKLEPLAKRVDAMTKANRRRLVEHGLITQEEFDAMEAAYKFYVPLRGKGERGPADFDATSGGAGRGLDTRRAPTKKALGRGAGNLAENILGEVIGDAQRGIILAEKARVGRTLMRLVLANPNPDLWSVEPVQTERKTDSEGMVYEAVINDWSDPSIVAVRHNGKLYRVQIENQPLAQALNSVGVDQMHTVFRALGALNRYFSAVLTKYNPAFTGVNAARDALFGLTGMAVEHGELAAARAALSYVPAAKAAFRQAAGLFNPNSEWDVWAKEFAESGGKTGYVNMPSVEDIQRKIGKGNLISYSPTGISRAAKAVADAVGIANDAVENALRLSAYVTLRKGGMSEAKAAGYAKDLTVNFNRKGLDGSTLNSLFLFYNASIQGAKRVGDLMRRPKAWGYLSALAGAQAVATLWMLGMEDDDGMNMWDKIPPHVKARNMVIPVNAEHFITIPMPYGFNLFVWLSGRMTDAFAQPNKKGNKASEIAADTISNAVQSFSPVPLDDGAMGLVPTAVRIPLNVQANRDDFGYQIRQDNPYGKYDVPRASMGKADTLEVFKITAKAMNRIGGGDDYTPPPMSFFDVAPEDLEYLLEELTGGTGKFLLDTTAAAAGLADPSRDMKPRDIPLTKRFFSNVDDVATQRSMFYDRRDSIERKLEQLRDIAKNDSIEQAEQFLKATPELKGAMFRRRKKVTGLKLPGTIIGADTGDVQIVEDKNLHDSVFSLYKAADKATKARGQAVKAAYAKAPPELLPNDRTRARDAEIREVDREAAEVQRRLNTVWTREVVGAADPTPTQP